MLSGLGVSSTWMKMVRACTATWNACQLTQSPNSKPRNVLADGIVLRIR